VLHDRLILLLQTSVVPVTNAMLRSEFSANADFLNITKVINHLLTRKRIVMFQDSAQNLTYELQSEEMAGKLARLTKEEQQVLQEVRKGKNHGVWIRDLRYNTRLQKNRIEKILKKLIIAGLIKSVKSIASMNRRLYMLKDVVPSRDISGGPWYTDSEFDADFISSLRSAIEQILRMSAHAARAGGGGAGKSGKTGGAGGGANGGTLLLMSTVDLHQKLSQVGVMNDDVELTVDHIQEIVDTLVYDAIIEEVDPQTGYPLSLHATTTGRGKVYRMVQQVTRYNWTNEFGQSYAVDSDYRNAFGRGRMTPGCSCGCGKTSGCGIASLSTESYLYQQARVRQAANIDAENAKVVVHVED
jgi:hypothetical protein